MNLAVAYRFTGEEPVELEKSLDSLCSSLRSAGHDVFCSIEREVSFRESGWSADQIYDFCRQEFKKREAIFVFLRSEKPSKGIELELSDAVLEGKPVFLATPTNVHLYRENATKVIEYESLAQLCKYLSGANLM